MKAGSYSQVYIQLVFSPTDRDLLLTENIRSEVFDHLVDAVNQMGHKSIIVNGTNDHVHLFLGLNPNVSITDTVKELKHSSSDFIDKMRMLPKKFHWQEGYGVFSYCKTQLENIYLNILNQEVEHKQTSFRKEYQNYLEEFEVEFDERYLLEFFE